MSHFTSLNSLMLFGCFKILYKQFLLLVLKRKSIEKIRNSIFNVQNLVSCCSIILEKYTNLTIWCVRSTCNTIFIVWKLRCATCLINSKRLKERYSPDSAKSIRRWGLKEESDHFSAKHAGQIARWTRMVAQLFNALLPHWDMITKLKESCSKLLS